ncbi:hypothetical protein D3C84_650600 [compost metagenome]
MHLLEHLRGAAADPALMQQRLLQQTQLCLQISARRQPPGTVFNLLTDLLALQRHFGNVVIVQSDLSRAKRRFAGTTGDALLLRQDPRSRNNCPVSLKLRYLLAPTAFSFDGMKSLLGPMQHFRG